MHGILDALVEPTGELVEDIDAGTERVQASRVGAAPDRRDVDHGGVRPGIGNPSKTLGPRLESRGAVWISGPLL